MWYRNPNKTFHIGICELAVCIRIESRIESGIKTRIRIKSRIKSFQVQRILSIQISNYTWSKRDVQNYIIPHYNPQTHYGVWSLIELSSLYTVSLSAVNGLSRLTKLTTSKGQARAIRFENFRIGQSLSNRIKSDGHFEFESNLEALQRSLIS